MTTLISREDGFTLTELMISTAIMLVVAGTALTTFKNALDINDAASQLSDTNQNLRAGSNQLVRDLMMAGRIISNEGVPVPAGAGAKPINRPGPPLAQGQPALTFSFVQDDDGTQIIPALVPGYNLGPTINGSTTDIVTILTVDEFTPYLAGVGKWGGTDGNLDPNAQAGIAPHADQITVPLTSPWLVGDPNNDFTPIKVGDIILFKNMFGMAMQTVTSIDTTAGLIKFESGVANDWFQLNQRDPSFTGTVNCIKALDQCDAAANPKTSPVTQTVIDQVWPATAALPGGSTALMRLQMITYYVDNSTNPGTPRLTRKINNFQPTALAGVVEDMDLTYDLVDSTDTTQVVSNLTTLPQTINGTKYTANEIKKVNVHLGVRSETISKPTQSYVRNHISTSVGVRSMAGVDRYDTANSPGS